MPRIRLEAFSRNPAKAAVQAHHLGNWVDRNPWLPDTYYSGAPARYGNGLVRATRNVLRLADVADFDAFLVRPGKGHPDEPAVLGLATIIGGHIIELPGSHQLHRGPDMDYVLDAAAAEADSYLPRATALGVLARTGQLYPGAEPFAVLTDPDGEHDPTGFVTLMDYRGMTENLQVYGGEQGDQYDIARGGEFVHVYTLTSPEVL